MKALGFKICVSAPYSYLAAPIELLFGHLKQTDLNPSNMKTGKR